MPNIQAVRAGRGRFLAITWKGGAGSVVDVSRHIADYAIFTPLRVDDDLFRGAAVGEWGWCVRWSNAMEISADTLWRLALEQRSSGTMSRSISIDGHPSYRSRRGRSLND